MLYVLEFNHLGKKYLLHNGTQFIGGECEEEAHMSSLSNIYSGISIGGFSVIGVTEDELVEMIGGIPYKIISFESGLVPFYGVEILN